MDQSQKRAREQEEEENSIDEKYSIESPIKKSRKEEEEDQETDEQDQQGGADEQSSSPSKKVEQKTRVIFPYGNYNKYYGYKRNKNEEIDARIEPIKEILQKLFCVQQDKYTPSVDWKQCLDENWRSILQNKSVLDIGCNMGYFDQQFSEHIGCKSLLGIDIDSSLVRHAWKLLKQRIASRSKNSKPVAFLEKIRFVSYNYVLPWKQMNKLQKSILRTKQDVILCLSVTKWIHLNFGDAGIEKLFKQIYNSLNEGGVLILEPQNFKSYRKRKNLTKTIEKNFAAIQLKPQDFPSYLLETVGFEHYEVKIPQGTTTIHKEFNRPIYAFFKNKPYYVPKVTPLQSEDTAEEALGAGLASQE